MEEKQISVEWSTALRMWASECLICLLFHSSHYPLRALNKSNHILHKQYQKPHSHSIRTQLKCIIGELLSIRFGCMVESMQRDQHRMEENMRPTSILMRP